MVEGPIALGVLVTVPDVEIEGVAVGIVPAEAWREAWRYAGAAAWSGGKFCSASMASGAIGSSIGALACGVRERF